MRRLSPILVVAATLARCTGGPDPGAVEKTGAASRSVRLWAT